MPSSFNSGSVWWMLTLSMKHHSFFPSLSEAKNSPRADPIALKVSTQGPVGHGISPNMRVWGNGRMSSMQSAIARHTPRNQKRKSHGKPNWKTSDNIFHTPLVRHVCDKKTSYLLTGTATSQRSHFPPSQIFHAKRNDFRSGMARSSWWTSKKLPDCIFWNLDEDEDFVDFLDIVDVPRANWSLSQRILVESWWKGSISCSTSFSSGSVSTTATSFGLCTPLLSMLQINSPSLNDASRESWWTMMLICCTIPAWSFPSRSSLQWPIISGATATGSTSALGQQIMAIESLGNSNHQHSANGSIQKHFLNLTPCTVSPFIWIIWMHQTVWLQRATDSLMQTLAISWTGKALSLPFARTLMYLANPTVADPQNCTFFTSCSASRIVTAWWHAKSGDHAPCWTKSRETGWYGE